MAYINGTAANQSELWGKLLSFLTTNQELVNLKQNWEVVWSVNETGYNAVTLKGPGLDQKDEIFVSLRISFSLYTEQESVLFISGSTGVSNTAKNYDQHPGSLALNPSIFLSNSPMEYWFVANGRRFIVVVKISTVYNALYGGLIIQYSPPDSYKYPLFIGGTRSANSDVISWRGSQNSNYTVFTEPNYYLRPVSSLLDPSVIWRGSSGDIRSESGYIYNMPLTQLGGELKVNVNGVYDRVLNRLIEGLDGEVTTIPITIFSAISNFPYYPTTYGILDGVCAIRAEAPVAESTFSANGSNFIIFPNVSRSAISSYWALKLE